MNKNFKNSLVLFTCSLLVVVSYLTLFFFDNLGEISLKDFLYSNFELFIFLILIFSSARLISQKLLFFIPPGIILIMQFNILSDALDFLHPIIGEGQLKIYLLIIFFCFWCMLAVLMWAKSSHELRTINFILTSFILLGNIIGLSAMTGNLDYNKIRLLDPEIADQVDTEIPARDLPNIIYIVPDRYSGIKQLKRYWDFDNSDFYQALGSRGFVLNEDSRSNYPFTYVSLPSTLNSSYLENDFDDRPLSASYQFIKNAKAFKNLKELGYHFVNIGNRWAGSQKMELADFNYYRNNALLSVTTYYFLNYQTPIINILNRVFPSSGLLSSCSSIKETFDSFQEISLSKESGLFIFAHMMVPHNPYLLNSKGKCVNRRHYKKGAEGFEAKRTDYLEYLQYGNKKFLEIFDAVNKNNNNFIFVIQADEGQYPLSVFPHDHDAFTKNDWDAKTGIVNAFYYSKNHELKSDDFLTPINNFAHIFDLLGENNIQKNPHQTYVLKPEKGNFNFVEFNFDSNE